MPWYEKGQPTPFDVHPVTGQFHLDGDLLARRYRQDWIHGKQYPTITFPSGLARELWDTSDGGGIVNIFGALELPRVGNRDEGFAQAIEFAKTYGYTIARRGDTDLLIFHPYSGNGYVVRYDNTARQIANVLRFPDYAIELLDVESRAVLPDLYSNEKLGFAAIAPVKFFQPDGSWTWFASEYDGDDTFFGLVSGFEVEIGYFSLSELEGIKGGLGLPIERDRYYTPATLADLKAKYEQDRRI